MREYQVLTGANAKQIRPVRVTAESPYAAVIQAAEQKALPYPLTDARSLWRSFPTLEAQIFVIDDHGEAVDFTTLEAARRYYGELLQAHRDALVELRSSLRNMVDGRVAEPAETVNAWDAGFTATTQAMQRTERALVANTKILAAYEAVAQPPEAPERPVRPLALDENREQD